MSAKVLLVEDEDLVGLMVQINLENAGHRVIWVKDGIEAEKQAKAQPIDLILLDISLPGQDGLSVLQHLRRAGFGTPIMMLTARSEVGSKVQALEGGADDYLPKPFDVMELTARVNALLRRSRMDREIPSENVVKVGAYSVNLETRQAESREGAVTLSDKEAALLKVLVASAGAVLTRSDILDEVWGMNASPTERTVDNFIVRLRKLFELDPANPRHIVTVRGVGYRFVA